MRPADSTFNSYRPVPVPVYEPLPYPARAIIPSVYLQVLRGVATPLMRTDIAVWLALDVATPGARVSSYAGFLTAPTFTEPGSSILALGDSLFCLQVPALVLFMAIYIANRLTLHGALFATRASGYGCLLAAATHAVSIWVRWRDGAR